MELVSIVIPVYNCETKLKRCLQSVQKQTYKDIEVLIVNDGSTDNSLQVCEEFCKQDVRFHVFNQKNHGVSYSRTIIYYKNFYVLICLFLNRLKTSF